MDITVIGLLPEQARSVEQCFKSVCSITFFGSDRHPTNLAQRVKGRVFVMTGFVSHKVTNTLRAAGIAYTPSNGGVSGLKTAIQTFIDEVRNAQ